MATKKTSTRAPQGARGTAKPANRKPRRREIGALIFLFLAVFAFIGYFSSEAFFIRWFCWLMKVLTGWGFYVIPPVLLFCSGVLAFHRGRPVTYRLICLLLIPVVVGGLYQLFTVGKAEKFTWEAFGTLSGSGLACTSGGLTGGLVAWWFELMFSKVGACAVFLVGSLFLLMAACNLTPSGIADRVRNMPRPAYEPEPPKETRKPRPAESDAAKKTGEAKKRVIDIPFEEGDRLEAPAAVTPEKPSGKKHGLFNTKPGVKTPAEVLMDEMAASATPDVPAEAEDQPSAVAVEPWEKKPAGDPWEAKQETVPWEEPVARRDAGPVPVEERKPSLPEEAATPQVQVAGVDSRHCKRGGASDEESFTPPETSTARVEGEYQFPGVELLNAAESSRRVDGKEEVALNRTRLESALRSFGVNTTISNVVRGPSITRYEFELEAGVKLNKITNLSEDIALALGSSGVRVAAIPDRVATVGIEVPNKIVSSVYLREIIESPEFQGASSKLAFAIGKNISGECIIGNIYNLPHLLVAGTTGSGKSVCLNAMILSILYRARPDEVKFIMIDPKMVEFNIYNGIPHLLVPVVTEAKKASGALQWAVSEMLKRYSMFSSVGARDLPTYNEIVRETEEAEPIPQIVVIIDELADLMMVAAKEVEESICRIAQMGRAAGVHLVIATQSPRADVITGIMKANIPSRISFKVASALESRIILDNGGMAEKLIGRGDMLFAPIGVGKPTRIQGAWVSDKERENIVKFLKKECSAEYSDEVIRHMERAASDKQGGRRDSLEESDSSVGAYDELLPQAVDVILECGQASVSMLQRRLKLGYSRAARVVDQMEEIGVVGPFEGSKPRQILISKQQWQERQLIQGTAPLERPAKKSTEDDD